MKFASSQTLRLGVTAITRARRLAVLVGSDKALRLAVDTAREVVRHGGLRERLRDELTLAGVWR